MENKGGLNQFSDFVNRLTAFETKQAQDYKVITSIQSKIEELQTINERLIRIDLKLESLGHLVNRLEERNWEIDNALTTLEKRIDINTVDVAHSREEIKRLYEQINSTYDDINTKLDKLNTTLKEEYLSNASFTKLQRNILWGVISFAGAILINVALHYLGINAGDN